MSDIHTEVARLADVAAKLLFETQRLRRDVMLLSSRIERFEGEEPLVELVADKPRKQWRLIEAFNVIDSARTVIHNCERELSAVRARMDSIEKDAISRTEMKPFLKP